MARPVLAPDPGDRQADKRSLVLAGGGMRVAYQAGVLTALDEEGLRFHHIDGTSGGTINVSMLLAGQSIDEMTQRWRALDPKGFAVPLPWRDYLRSPHWPALGGGDGVRNKVFPALGIAPDRIRRSTGMAGTYNVCNFATKTAEVVEHPDVDEDLLLASISLPVLMPAVQWNGAPYTDAVWIRDSNVPEAVRRGSDEVWLVWCIGNTADYQNGSFRQYVHMIEMAANGSLLGDLHHLAGDPAGSGLSLHVVKPSRPLPLDPDYYLGRIDAAELIGLGYRDAKAYLHQPRPITAPWGPGVTAMLPVEAGVAGRLVLTGTFEGGPARVHLRLQAQPPYRRPLSMDAVGDVQLPGWASPRPVEHGQVTFAGPHGVVVQLTLDTPSGPQVLSGRASGDRVVVTLQSGAARAGEPAEAKGRGSLVLGSGLARLAAGLHATGTRSSPEGLRARASVARVIWEARRGGLTT